MMAALRLPVRVEVIFVVLVTTSIQHWKEKVRETEGERERERAREPLSGGVSGGHVDRMVSWRFVKDLLGKEASLLSRFCFIEMFSMSAPSYLSVRLSNCPVGIPVPTARPPSDEIS
jgi:hypothetical protein